MSLQSEGLSVNAFASGLFARRTILTRGTPYVISNDTDNKDPAVELGEKGDGMTVYWHHKCITKARNIFVMQETINYLREMTKVMNKYLFN